ncbi:MAG TPA: type I 3-dehydroquinate dehydratase [Vicinamibacterales bacterium]|nr:type I 3-dehydroquinate dehydratase [Vicinamibacterales bacterium]
MRAAKLCVTVTAATTAELRERRDRVTDADLIELRVDSVRDPSAAGALAGRRTPVIFTCRPRWEGGSFAGSEEERRRILRDAQQLGADYIDVEANAGFDELLAARGGQGIVLSMHDFAGVPSDLDARLAAMRATGAEVIKIAVMAHRLTDCLPLLAIGRRATSPTVLVAMGDAGVATRVLATQFRSSWTYAGDGVVPGQMPVAQLRDECSFRSVHARTAVYGVVGRPVMHSISPAMHNAAFRAVRIDAVYVPLAAADFKDFLTFAEAVGLRGASVTAPFKVDAYEHAAESDPTSRRVQSVNTLRRVGDRWTACNTDVAGFLAPLQGRTRLQGCLTTVMGAGGTARAVAEALSAAGAHVSIAARRRDQAEEVASRTGAVVTSWPPTPGSWEVLVNATPVGTMPNVDESALDPGALAPGTGTGAFASPRSRLGAMVGLAQHGDPRLVYDLVYNPPDTQLLRDARAAGLKTLGGLDMLVAQAQLQFEWWTGVKPSERVMRDAATAALRKPTV